jgi:hypothetical protein
MGKNYDIQRAQAEGRQYLLRPMTALLLLLRGAAMMNMTATKCHQKVGLAYIQACEVG